MEGRLQKRHIPITSRGIEANGKAFLFFSFVFLLSLSLGTVVVCGERYKVML